MAHVQTHPHTLAKEQQPETHQTRDTKSGHEHNVQLSSFRRNQFYGCTAATEKATTATRRLPRMLQWN